jgi:hypothetical protein
MPRSAVSVGTEDGIVHDVGRAVRRVRRRECCAGALALLVVLLAACAHHAGTLEGSALASPPPGLAGFGPIPPGQQVESLDVGLWNTSGRSLRLDRVTVSGQGVGTVGQILKMEIAPTRVVDVGTNKVPDGEWVTYPPVAFFENRCNVQTLSPLVGYLLAPDAQVRVAMLLKAGSPGLFKFTSVDVYYRSDGTSYVQSIANGTKFSVQMGAPRRQISQLEQPCVQLTTVLPMGD